MSGDESDRLSAAIDGPFDRRSLVGSFFHSDPQRGWQGCVVAEVAPQVYLVETFDWLACASYDQQLVALADMAGWTFYDTAEWLRNSSEGTQRRWARERGEAGAAA